MEPTATFPSPDGRYRLDLFPHEMRMSHWVNAPYIFDNQVGKYIIDIGNYWDASKVKWTSDSSVLSFKLRHYADGSVDFSLELNLTDNKATLSATGYGNVLAGSIVGVTDEMARTSELRTIFY